MAEIFKILKDTPIPSILVVGGILFLLLSFVRKVGSSIELEPTKTWLVAIIGVILLCSGIALSLIPAFQASLVATPTQTPLNEIATQASQPNSTIPTTVSSTPTPISIETITLLGNSNEGKLFTANQSGMYILKYIDGAYSTFPVSNQGLWQTSVRIYKNRPVAWEQNSIGGFDYEFAAFGEVSSKEQAMSNANGSSISIQLSQNDYIYMIAVDGKNNYADNPGEVVIEILFIPQ